MIVALRWTGRYQNRCSIHMARPLMMVQYVPPVSRFWVVFAPGSRVWSCVASERKGFRSVAFVSHICASTSSRLTTSRTLLSVITPSHTSPWTTKIALAPNLVAVVSHHSLPPTLTVASVCENWRWKRSTSTKIHTFSKTTSAASSADCA